MESDAQAFLFFNLVDNVSYFVQLQSWSLKEGGKKKKTNHKKKSQKRRGQCFCGINKTHQINLDS